METDRHKTLQITGGARGQNEVCIVCLSHVGTLLMEYLQTEWIERNYYNANIVTGQGNSH